MPSANSSPSASPVQSSNPTPSGDRRYITATVLGFIAILIWASLVAVARGTQEHMGVLPAAAVANVVGGAIGIAVAHLRTGYLKQVVSLPRKYLFGCGLLFIVYNATLFSALQLAGSEHQVVEVGLIQYLWPALTLAFSVPLLGKRATFWLWPGLLIATAGAFLAKSGGVISWASFLAGLDANPWPYLLALVAAVSWAFHSNLARRWGGPEVVSAAPVFLAVTGVVLAILHTSFGGHWLLVWQARPLLELAYLAIFPTLLAYLFWDIAMRRGNMVLVASFSFFTPLLSTIITCIYLGLPMGAYLWLAAGLVVAGAAVCKRSVEE